MIIFPGLCGGSDGNYTISLASQLEAAGFHVGVYNNEGITDTPLLNDQILDFSTTDSVARALRYVKGKFPNKNLFCVAISFGASRTMKTLSEMEDYKEIVQGFVSLSNPFNLEKSGHAVSYKKKNSFYSWVYTENMKIYFRNLLSIVEDRIKEAEIDIGKDKWRHG